MINDIKQVIVNKLKEIYPDYTIYDEDVPQGFKTPSFFITLIEQDYSKRLNTKYKSLLSFDLAYFSNKDNTEIKNDCYSKQVELLRALDLVGGYRIQDKVTAMVENVLHITFNVNYSEMLTETENMMQEIEDINTNI